MAKSFEDNITRLEEIVSQLERGDAKLADSFHNTYQEVL